MPVLTATATPPDEPSGVRFGSHGLQVIPNASDAVHRQSISSLGFDVESLGFDLDGWPFAMNAQ